MNPIEETFQRLASLQPDRANWLLTEKDSQPDWLSAADLAAESSSHIGELLRRVLSKYKADGLHPPAALWFGHYAYAIEIVSIACFMIERCVPDLSLANLKFRFDNVGDVESIAWIGRSFAALPDDPAAGSPDCIILSTHEALRNYLRERLAESFTPVIEAVSSNSGMGKPGLWALAADYTAYAFTTLAEMLGDETLGVEESRLFSATNSKLSVKRDFIPIEHIGTTHYLLERTSCCLYYKVEGGGYCHSCPHRPLDERIELVKRHMEEEAAA
jgi:ferric iron reductase protein FhuF